MQGASKYASNIQPLPKRTPDAPPALSTKAAPGAATRKLEDLRRSRGKSIEKIIRSNPVLPVPSKEKHTNFQGLHRPVMLIVGSGYLLETICQLSGELFLLILSVCSNIK